MKNTRLTDKEVFARLIAIVEGAEVADKEVLIDRLNHKIELIENKANTRSDKPTQNQVENNEYKKIILDTLAENNAPMTITDLKSVIPQFANFTPQKISALLQALGDRGTKQVIKTENKRKAYFSLAV